MNYVNTDVTTVSAHPILPYVPVGKRIIPNDLIRSSLFTVTNHNIRREYIKQRELYSFGDTKITYTGEELRQDDQDVWLQLIYMLAKCADIAIQFSPYSMLKELDWPARTQYRDKLKDSIDRMSASNITIINKTVDAGLTVSLIRKFMWRSEGEENLKKWMVWLEPEIALLFKDMYYSKILWDQRKKLNPLAKWLHSYYSSHAEPYAIKVSTLHLACGSKTKEMKHFKASLREALCELVQVGFLESYWIDARNLTHVEKKTKYNLLEST
jgi:hypothetical protein